VGFLLASTSPELAAVTIVIIILFVASLLALAPLRKVRLPFTVAVMLVGFAIGALLKSGHSPEGAGHGGFLADIAHILKMTGSLSPDLIFFVFLPPLVFESAYNLDARELIKNLAPITVLAVPVLIFSTGITGAGIMLAGGEKFGFTWPAALLFGALISATDPVAVVALFKDLGAPKRLGVLVEGESLFNDGTAIVLFTILLAFVVTPMGADASIGGAVLGGVGGFFRVAFGGLAVGLVMAWLLLSLIGSVISDERVEISLMVVLAYASFVIAEHFLHVSGVIAAVAAGLLAGSWGKTKVSHSVGHFMHAFWEYLGFVMNSLIFFFVGIVIPLRVDWEHVAGGGDQDSLLPLLAAALGAAIVARAVGVFGTVPFMKRFGGAVSIPYQTVMWWGGLRGAVSLALALLAFGKLYLTDDPNPVGRHILVLAAGIVLFTLLVNALSMQPLIVFFGLDKPTPVDRFAMAYAEKERTEVAARVLERLEKEGAVLPSVLDEMRDRIHTREQAAHAALRSLKGEIESHPGASEAVAARIALAVEKQDVMHRFGAGALTEPATKALLNDADRLLDHVKHGHELPAERTIKVSGALESRLLSALEPLGFLGALARRKRASRLAQDIEATRGLYLVTRSVSRTLAEIEQGRGIELKALAKVQARYSTWMFKAHERLNQLTSEFPEYAACSQAMLAELQALRAEGHSLHHLVEAGLLTDKALSEARAAILKREGELRGVRATGLELDPLSLLHRVPAFQGIDEEVLRALASKLVSRTYLEGEPVVTEGGRGASMFLIARGAVAVTAKDESGQDVHLSTLDAGSFFGEIALLLGGTRRATVRAVTPVNLLELDREGLEAVMGDNPGLAEQVRAEIYPRAIGRALVNCPSLASLSPEQRSSLSMRFVPEEHGEGKTVASKGDPQRLIYVSEGRLGIGDEVIEDGAAIGAHAFADAAHEHDVVAHTDVRLLVLPAEALVTFRGENPATADACARARPS